MASIDHDTLLKGLETFAYVMSIKRALSNRMGREVTLNEVEMYLVGIDDATLGIPAPSQKLPAL